MKSRLGTFLALGLAGVLALFAVLVFRASDEGLSVPGDPNRVTFGTGHAQGERLDSHAWSVDYDSVVANSDQTILQLQGIHNGVIYKAGKPYLRVKAKHLTVNTVTKDFSASGPMHVERIGAARIKSFDTNAGDWSNAQQRLLLPNPVVVALDDGSHIHVAKASINLRSGHIHLESTAGTL